MSQIKFDKPLQIKLRLSSYYLLYNKLIHLLALVSLLLPYALAPWLRACLLLVVIFSFIRSVNASRQQYTGQLHLIEKLNWLWIVNNNEQPMVFDSGAIILTNILVMNFTSDKGKKQAWCFFPDSGDEELFRLLRIYLLYSTAETGSGRV